MIPKAKSIAFFIITLLLLFPGKALADELSAQFGGNPMTVPDGHSVESVLAMSTDAHIAGEVRDIVFVINGDVYLEPTARTDLVLDLGGHVYNQANVSAKTGIIQLSLTSRFINELFTGLVMVFGFWLVRLLLSVVAIVLFTGLGFLLRKRLQRGKNFLETSAIRLLGIGLVATLVILGLIILLCLTVVGIPLAVLIFLVGIAGMLFGILPVMEYAGQKALSPRLWEYPALTRWLVLALLFVSVLNLPLIGGIVLLGLAFTGSGVALTTGWIYLKERRRDLPNIK